MGERRYSSLRQYYEETVREAMEECTLCGECVRNCQTFPLIFPGGKGQGDIMAKLLDFLKGGTESEEVYRKVFGCDGCGNCSSFCPQGIDVLLLHEAAKIKLADRQAFPAAVNFVLPGRRPNLYDILSSLQVRPEEKRWLTRPPAGVKAVQDVVFLGCSLPSFPHVAAGFLEIMEELEEDFVALAGDELCCGTSLCPAAGKVDEAEQKARELVESITKLSARRVILLCTGCYRQFTEFYPKFLDLDFDVVYYTQFLFEKLGMLEFRRPLERTVVLHESCMTRRTGLFEPTKGLLGAIPGLKLVEMKNPEAETQTLCCGGLANMTFPDIGQRRGSTLVEQTMRVMAEFVLSTCPFCQLAFYPHARTGAFAIQNIPGLILEAMGRATYEDRLGRYWRCESVEKIIAESREFFEANGRTEEEMRQILPMVFPVLG
jgi:Fe-S oxidoreductase